MEWWLNHVGQMAQSVQDYSKVFKWVGKAAHGLRFISLRYFNAAGAHVSGKIGEAHNPESHLIPLIL